MSLSRALFLFSVGIALAISLRRWVVEPIYVAGVSMEPALPAGARLFADKVTLSLRPPRRGDIVLFPAPTGERLNVGKRVIATAGESLELRAKKVFIDGIELLEPYAVHRRPTERLINDDLGPLRVPAESVFVLGDNRDGSEDSTVWKSPRGRPIYFIPTAAINGLVRPLSGTPRSSPSIAQCWDWLAQRIQTASRLIHASRTSTTHLGGAGSDGPSRLRP